MKLRIRLMALFFLVAFSAILGRLFYWQIIDRKRLSLLASQQHFVRKEIEAERGKIFSADGFPLVLNQKTYLLYVNPQQLKLSAKELSEKLTGLAPVDEKIRSVLGDKRIFWYPLNKDLTEDMKEKIEGLEIEGLGFEEREKRDYPEASLSAQLLGFVGEDQDGREKGYFGLEGFYDYELKGKAGSLFYEKDALGRPIFLTEGMEEKPIAGRSLVLHLDRGLQYLAEKHLKEGLAKFKASSGMVLIMDPNNGAILTMASYPTYDPLKYYRFEESLYRNPVISSSFEPGSIFKIIVMAAALDGGAVQPGDICFKCSGPRETGGYSVKNWDDKYFPNSSLEEIIMHSDNVGMFFVAEKMGLDRLYRYLTAFGLGEKTGVDLQGEITPLLRKKSDWREIDLATASFGQGVAVTPIQFLRAVCAIANGGWLYQPQVVKKILEDEAITVEPKKVGRPISYKSAKAVTEMMVTAVGSTKWDKPKGYKIAGKTGTAQVPIAGHYDPQKTVASFVGFAPADKPRFAMLVTVKEPKASPWGATTAVPIWMEIARDIFRLWKIPPTE